MTTRRTSARWADRRRRCSRRYNTSADDRTTDVSGTPKPSEPTEPSLASDRAVSRRARTSLPTAIRRQRQSPDCRRQHPPGLRDRSNDPGHRLHRRSSSPHRQRPQTRSSPHSPGRPRRPSTRHDPRTITLLQMSEPTSTANPTGDDLHPTTPPDATDRRSRAGWRDRKRPSAPARPRAPSRNPKCTLPQPPP